MKVTTSCSGRFWIFDQARELEKLGILDSLICDYPKFKAREWDIPNDKIVSLLSCGVYARLCHKILPKLDFKKRSKLSESVHTRFSSRLARFISSDTDVFIGLSSFSLEAIRVANSYGVFTMVDHGSSHQEFERRIQAEESELLGIKQSNILTPDWVIEKEQHEFLESNAVMVLSEFAKRTMVSNGIKEEKIFVNNCGVNLNSFFPKKKKDNVFRIIQCGAIHQGKGVQYLIKAFYELNLPNSELWFIGGGLANTNLKPIIKKYQRDNIKFLGSFPQNKLVDLYAQGTVFVLPSISDGFGMVVPQAMACGLPVIVSENVGASDLVDNSENGFVIPIRDVESLKEKITYFFENSGEVENMGRYARNKIEKDEYTWSGYGKRLKKYLDEKAK